MPFPTALDARVLLSSGHFVATGMTAALRGMEGGVACMICFSFALAFVSFVGGWELFSTRKNSLHATAHFVGGLLQARIVLYDLPTSPHLWYVVLLSHAPATAATLDSLAKTFLFPHTAGL